jgi:DNA-binding transcriptional LysR family regulator
MKLENHLDKLRAFKIIAETNKLGEAAKIIGLTQPSLSRLINTLEEALENKLFYRSRSGTFLTPSGELLLEYTNTILAPIKDLEFRIKNGLSNEVGHLRVGSYESLAEYLWPDFLADFSEKNPNITISVKTTLKKNNIHALETGEIDLSIDAEPRIVGDFDSYPLYSDDFSFYGNQKILNAELLEKPIIFVPNVYDQSNKSLDSYILDVGLQNNERMELDSFTVAHSFCKKGLGIAILPNRLAQKSLKNCLLYQYKLKGVGKKTFGKHTIYSTISSKRSKDKKVQILIKALKKSFRG